MTAAETFPTFHPVGDQGVLVEFATEFDAGAHEQVLALGRRLASRPLASDPLDDVVEVVPALVNLLVLFDPIRTDHAGIEGALRSLIAEPAGRAAPARRQEVAVCYDESVAPDLAAVAASCGLSVEATIDAHLSGDYELLMYGFAPGYAYLGGVPKTIHVPRKSAAVRGVRAGSVIIAGQQCLVTTIEMPTGWSIIGRSPFRTLPSDPDQPFPLDPGDRVTFTRVDLATLERLEADGSP